MLARMLLPFEFFTKRNRDDAAVSRNCFEPGGQGEQIDAEISRLAGLPKIYPNYRDEFKQALAGIEDPQKKELYRMCGYIAHGVRGLSDCHHSSFRYIEKYIHAIGTLTWEIPDRVRNQEGTRLGQTLFGYALGLDRWLQCIPHQFLLLDLGYADLGFNPANEVKRVYAYLGKDRTPVKEWLAACVWYKVTLERAGKLDWLPNLTLSDVDTALLERRSRRDVRVQRQNLADVEDAWHKARKELVGLIRQEAQELVRQEAGQLAPMGLYNRMLSELCYIVDALDPAGEKGQGQIATCIAKSAFTSFGVEPAVARKLADLVVTRYEELRRTLPPPPYTMIRPTGPLAS